MFWIIVFVISTILAGAELCRCIKKGHSPHYVPLPVGLVYIIIISIVSLVTIFLQGETGICEYPKLTEQVARIEALQSRTQDIKEAYYKHEKDGNFIAGSVENMTQSTNLSKYISNLATEEAAYRGKLQKVKTYREVFPLYFFGYGWAISDKVYDLPVTIKKE